jgi:site-specific DNA-methyltransferase (adenine-specific)
MFEIDEIVNKVHCADCLEFMKQMPDKSVDCVITDPPYGIGAYSTGTMGRGVLAKQSTFEPTNWDNSIPSQDVFDEMMRVSKNQIIFGGNYFIEYLTNSSCWIVWDKDNGSNDFADCELAWTSFKTAVRKFKWKWQGMLQENMKNKDYRWHPTQKPEALMRWVISNYTNENDLILDPFLGSGTTAVAAKLLNRRYIGIEIEKRYCEIAEKRLAQQTLGI